MTSNSRNVSMGRIIFTTCMVLIAAIGILGTSIFLFAWSVSEPNMLFPAIAFTVIVGAMMIVVLSIIAHATLGMGLRELVRYLVFSAQYWALGRTQNKTTN